MFGLFNKKKKCKHCGKIVTGRHYCTSSGEYVSYDSTDDLILFMMTSDISSDSNCECSHSCDSCYDSSSSYDSGSSGCDSGGSCGGCD